MEDNFSPMMSPLDAERYVEALRKFSVEEVGSSEFMQYHENLERLNLQAHQSALSKHDEFVIEAVLTFGKLEVLVHNLLVVDIWKRQVFPLLVERLAHTNSMRLYFVLYNEATVVNLLELCLFHRHICEQLNERLIEVIDFATKKILQLHNNTFDKLSLYDSSSKGKTAKQVGEEILARDRMQELVQQSLEIDFRVCVSCVSLARLVIEHADNLSLGVITRIQDTHDLLLLFIPLIENPPWTRRGQDGKWQKLVDFKWEYVQPIDLLRVTKLEGQPWIALYHLLSKKVFRERYHIHSHRKGQILRVRKYLNEMFTDQLPFLVDIQRYLDELAISADPGEGIGVKDNVFMFQQVSTVVEKMIAGKDWPAIASQQVREVFTMTDATDKDLRKMASLYSDDAVEELLEPSVLTEDLDDISSQLRR